ncbi:MAG TPA: hypothetical protein VHN80_13410 [Kineosporiaceae bacterium]|nr:hypothetical protein [Kineosporiaceae bacterium]
MSDHPAAPAPSGEVDTLPDGIRILPATRLAGTLTPTLAAAVDELHLAAVLESRGLTDQIARDEYGCDDVFSLAVDVADHLPSRPDGDARTIPRPPRHPALRSLVHGPLYIMPSAVYPAVWVAIGGVATLHGMLLATALSWVWGMGTSAVAYQLLGQGRARSAARSLRMLSLAGLSVALVGATTLALIGTGGPGMVAFVMALVAFQLISGVLVFYGKEWWLGLMMLPAFGAGVLNLAHSTSDALVRPTLIAAAGSVALILGGAWIASTRSEPPDPTSTGTYSRTLVGAAPSISYAVLCAVFLLFTDSRYLSSHFDLAIAAAPLILGMGAVEWRAHRFTEAVDDLLCHSGEAGQFRLGAWRLLLHELSICLLVLGALGVALLGLLLRFGWLTLSGAMLVDAHILLGGAFFLGFVLARHQRFPWLLGILATVVAVNVLLVFTAADTFSPNGEIPIFLGSTLALLVLLTFAFKVSLGRIYTYR